MVPCSARYIHIEVHRNGSSEAGGRRHDRFPDRQRPGTRLLVADSAFGVVAEDVITTGARRAPKVALMIGLDTVSLFRAEDLA